MQSTSCRAWEAAESQFVTHKAAVISSYNQLRTGFSPEIMTEREKNFKYDMDAVCSPQRGLSSRQEEVRVSPGRGGFFFEKLMILLIFRPAALLIDPVSSENAPLFPFPKQKHTGVSTESFTKESFTRSCIVCLKGHVLVSYLLDTHVPMWHTVLAIEQCRQMQFSASKNVVLKSQGSVDQVLPLCLVYVCPMMSL